MRNHSIVTPSAVSLSLNHPSLGIAHSQRITKSPNGQHVMPERKLTQGLPVVNTSTVGRTRTSTSKRRKRRLPRVHIPHYPAEDISPSCRRRHPGDAPSHLPVGIVLVVNLEFGVASRAQTYVKSLNYVDPLSTSRVVYTCDHKEILALIKIRELQMSM